MWTYKGEIIRSLDDMPAIVYGFVYRTLHEPTGKKYIGKKNFFFARSKMVKGKKKRFKIESDWKTYYGSNKELIADVELEGAENFKRVILRLCKTKSEFGYYEAKWQFDLCVLESDAFYNSYIMCRINKKHMSFINKA